MPQSPIQTQEQKTEPPFILDTTSEKWTAGGHPNGDGDQPTLTSVTWFDFEGALIPSGTSSLQPVELFAPPKLLWARCLYPRTLVSSWYRCWQSLGLEGAPIEIKITTEEQSSLETSTDVASEYDTALKSDTEIELRFLSMSHDLLERQIDLEPDFLDALNELALVEGKDSPSKQRF